MKKILFYTFITVFGATAVITLLGLVNLIDIDPNYLEKLFYLLIAEVIAPVIALFKKTDFFDENNFEKERSKINIVMLPKDAFPRNSDPHKCTVTVYNQDTDEEREVLTEPIRANGYLSMFLNSLNDQEMIKVHLKNTSNQSWESEYFNPSVAKAEMEAL